jgi:all-trans-retinol 13,14-reductase
MMKYDIIIIGSGLAGLIAGAKLSKEGKKVMVIEQHSKPGGCATSFKRGEFVFEVGLHEMDMPSPSEMKSRIFSDLDVFKNVEFIKVPEFYHFDNERVSITIPHDHEAATKKLIELFPEEKAGITSWFNAMLAPRKKNQSDNQPDISVGEYLDSIINNDDLKLILMGNLGYFHDDPYSLSLNYYFTAQSSYFNNGGCFIKGGSQKMSTYLAEFIKSHGGEVLLGNLVISLSLTGNEITGVSYRKKKVPDSEVLTATSDQVVYNGSLPGLKNLLPAQFSPELETDLAGEVTGTSLLTLFLGFKRPLREIGSGYYSTFFYDESVSSLADIKKNNKADFSKRSFTFVDYGQIDSGLAPAGKSEGVVCCIDYLEDWIELDEATYKSKKELVARTFIERLNKFIPGIKNEIEFSEIGTAKTVRRYTLNEGGATHGFVNTPLRKPADVLKSITNLHIASAWGKTGGGFSGAIYGGYLTAISLLRKSRSTEVKSE